MDQNQNNSQKPEGVITPPPLSSPPKPPVSSASSNPPSSSANQPTPNIPTPQTPTPSPVTPPPASPPPQPPIESTSPSPSPSPEPSQSDSPPPQKPAKIKKSPFRLVGPLIAVAMVLGLIGFVVFKFILNKTPNTPKDVTLTYQGLWEPTPALEQVFADFEAQNPGVKINYALHSPKDYRERLQAQIERGETPDIFRYHSSWVPMLKSYLAPVPKNIFSSSEFEKTFYPAAADSLKLSSSYMGIPLEFDGLALYYNKEIFQKANKTPPTTWNEVRTLASELTLRNQQGRIIRGGIALGTTSNVDHWPDILALMMLQNASNPGNPVGQRAEDSLSFYTIFAKTDKVWDDTMPSSTVAFAEEKVAMMIAPSWRAFDIKNTNPDLDFATVPTPQLTNVNLHWASFWAEGVSNQTTSEKQELAWKLLKFMVQPENLRKFYQEASTIRLFGEPYPRQDMAEELIDDPIVGAYIESAPYAKGWWMSSWTFDNGLNDRIIKYYEDAINSVSSGQSPKKALETAASGVVQILSQFGVSGALN